MRFTRTDSISRCMATNIPRYSSVVIDRGIVGMPRALCMLRVPYSKKQEWWLAARSSYIWKRLGLFYIICTSVMRMGYDLRVTSIGTISTTVRPVRDRTSGESSLLGRRGNRVRDVRTDIVSELWSARAPPLVGNFKKCTRINSSLVRPIDLKSPFCSISRNFWGHKTL